MTERSPPRPWALGVEPLLRALGTGPLGLSAAEAASRLASDGPNQLPAPPRASVLRELAGQFTHFMALLLWAAGILAFVSGTPELGWAIWSVVLINGAFSFWQERRAERALSALRQQLPQAARAWRNGHLSLLQARDLVRGDVVELALGDRVPADARLLVAERLRLDLSLLTGESMPVNRAPQPGEPLCALAEETGSVVLAGASVVGGRGRAVIFATGRDTALGQVARLTAGVTREPSTLSVQVARLVRAITALAVGIGLLVFALGYWLVGFTVPEALLFAIGIVVANVPEGLLPTVTLALALGVQRMARRRVLVRRLPAIETLSAVSVVATDKTGTLTENRMTVRSAWTPDGGGPLGVDAGSGRLHLVLAAGALCTEAASVAGSGEERAVARDPLEAALLNAARATGIEPAAGAPVAVVKGAPSAVMARCQWALRGGQVMPLDAADRTAAEAEADRLGAAGHRVLAVACREASVRPFDAALEQDLVLLGLLGIEDPPRRGVTEALRRCRGPASGWSWSPATVRSRRWQWPAKSGWGATGSPRSPAPRCRPWATRRCGRSCATRRRGSSPGCCPSRSSGW
jgi:magnesium-transporting ATPase (P-type)